MYSYTDEDNAPMHDSMLPSEKNCHQRCPYSRICWEKFHCKGSHDPNYPYECPNYDYINDKVMDAQDIPFCDPDEIDTGVYEDGTDP